VNLTPGQLYFINEQDVKTGERSSYFKIGIVRESDERDSKDRLLEHQTGNPRRLVIVETLNMPAVEEVETSLHYLFARNWAMGEWMRFTDDELKKAISRAKELATAMQGNIQDFKRAEELSDIASNGVILPATPVAQELYQNFMNYKEVVKSCDEAIDEYKSYLYQAIEKGEDVAGKANIQNRPGAKKFDEKLFSSKYPDLYKKFSTSTYPIKGFFRPKLNKDWVPDISSISQEQTELIIELKDEISKADHSLESGFLLHGKHQGVLEIRKYAELESGISNTKLRVITGEAEGIEGICAWKREPKETIFFDKQKIQADYPEEYDSCVVQGKDTKALIVNPRIAEI
jgi:hypothetical protein